MSVSTYNAAVNSYNNKITNYMSLLEKFNNFIEQFNKMDQGQNIGAYLIERGVINQGKVDKNHFIYRQLHPYNR